MGVDCQININRSRPQCPHAHFHPPMGQSDCNRCLKDITAAVSGGHEKSGQTSPFVALVMQIGINFLGIVPTCKRHLESKVVFSN